MELRQILGTVAGVSATAGVACLIAGNSSALAEAMRPVFLWSGVGLVVFSLTNFIALTLTVKPKVDATSSPLGAVNITSNNQSGGTTAHTVHIRGDNDGQ